MVQLLVHFNQYFGCSFCCGSGAVFLLLSGAVLDAISCGSGASRTHIPLARGFAVSGAIPGPVRVLLSSAVLVQFTLHFWCKSCNFNRLSRAVPGADLVELEH